ncbi:putative phosphodiesterase [Dysgonomonas sp. PH5-45]|uniref:metallophosphoesterase family protein n=1 Tax=unclassified Dysgonomonas TaxID=2630389 RepID=UPI0024730341|nr:MULTISPECIES: metallophosphoesterase [unclassified Dysgonomonas]MDH6354870.1 putative phosphodiesterase [Dysgonomonas sp. PH5-45]MDH6387769.1 putative phosphodiesterase [Dysgonomonas sp. PH5-37]
MARNILILIASVLIFSGCDAFEYHPYDGRITGEKNINAKNITRIEAACKDKDTIRFVMTGDTQRWYDETEAMVKNINRRTDIDFVIHGGDLADFGLTKEFLWMRDIMGKLKVPYVAVIGNHDCLGNGEEIYRKIWGKENFSFMAGNVKFVCLNTNALEYSYDRPIPDFTFIEDQYNEKREGHEKTVFVMHARPYSEQFNNNVARVFQRNIKEFPKLQFCLNAHDHQVTADDLFDDGIIYYGSPNVAKRKYLLFTILPNDKYEYEVVSF